MSGRLAGWVRRAWVATKARRALWMALGAVAFGAVAVVGARNYIGERVAIEKARLQPRHETVDVVVAKRELRRGERIGGDTMAVRALPRDVAPGGAVTPATFDAVAGQRLVVPLRAGEPLLASAVASVDAAPISSRVRPGIRAMTISVDEVNSLSGMLQPGDRIDLLLSVRPPAAHGLVQPEVTRTVMQGVPVLATGRQSRASAGDEPVGARAYTAITVEVDPEQAQRLVVAQRSGRLTAVLRNPEDRARVEDRRLDVNALLGIAPPTIAAGPAPVEVIVGGRGQAPAQSGAPGAASVPSAPGTAPAPGGPGSSATASPQTPQTPQTPQSPALPAIPPSPPTPDGTRPMEPPRPPMFDQTWTPQAPATVPLYR